MNQSTAKLVYIFGFIISFFVFLLLTFPFEVLKETISQKASEVSGLNISMKSLSPNFPVGVNVEGLEVSRPGGKKVKIQEVDVDLSLLSLFTGKVGVDLSIDNGAKGDLDLDVGIPFTGLFSGNPIPSKVSLESQKFLLTDLINFGMDFYVNSPGVNPLIGPMVGQFKIKTSLDSKVSIDLDTSDPKNSDGQAVIKFLGLSMQSTDPALGIPEQRFKTAQIIAKMSNGNFKIDQRSKFVSDQLGLNLNGNIGLKKPIPRSTLTLDVGMALSGAIKDNLGSLIAMLVLKTDSSTWDGNATLQLGGTLAFPTVNPLLGK